MDNKNKTKVRKHFLILFILAAAFLSIFNSCLSTIETDSEQSFSSQEIEHDTTPLPADSITTEIKLNHVEPISEHKPSLENGLTNNDILEIVLDKDKQTVTSHIYTKAPTTHQIDYEKSINSSAFISVTDISASSPTLNSTTLSPDSGKVAFQPSNKQNTDDVQPTKHEVAVITNNQSSLNNGAIITEPPTKIADEHFLQTPLVSESQNQFSSNDSDNNKDPIMIYAIIILLLALIISFAMLKKYKSKLRIAEGNARYQKNRIEALEIADIEDSLEKLTKLHEQEESVRTKIINLEEYKNQLSSENENLEQANSRYDTRISNYKKKISRYKELYSSIEYSLNFFHEVTIPEKYHRSLNAKEKLLMSSDIPTIGLTLHNLNYKDLRKEFQANQKQIDSLLEEYKNRYTTKANKTIYKLMIMALRSELQNILYNLKFERLQNAIEQVKTVTAKYLVITTEGNQSIAGTMRKFIGQLEYLFINAVNIEYEYYIKKEQAKQEQLALRQQIKEEAEEQRRLREQEKHIANEEAKYQTEIQKIQEAIANQAENEPLRLEYEKRIEELENLLIKVEEQKDEITRLQHGKAGNVYIISNLGSFGNEVFKIGMTRRIDPQERVNELGSASVPFKFDVHSFIFSEDAVGLENEMHKRLHSKRLNKVNLRKEFFNASIEELEDMVMDICPSAEFNRTMLAEDYNQTLSMNDQELPFTYSNEQVDDEKIEEEKGLDDIEYEDTLVG